MATAIGDLVVRFGAQTRGFQRGVGQVRTGLGSIGAAATSMAAKVAGAFGALSAGVAFAGAIRSGEEFNRKMRNSLAIMSDVSTAMRRDMRDAAFQVAKSTRFGASEAAEAFYFLASAGLTAKQSIAALPQVAAFAQAGNFDLARATDLATDAQMAIGLASQDAQQNLRNLARVTDVLIGANTLGNASAEQFSEALTNKAGTAAKVYSQTLEDTVAVLVVWANKGIKGAEAGTAFNIVMRDLTSKALENAAAFKKHGVEVYDRQTGQVRRLIDILGQLEAAFVGKNDMQKKAMLQELGFADKSVIFIQSLIGSSEAARDFSEQLDKMGGKTKKVADQQLTPFQQGWAKLHAAMTNAGAVIMDTLGPSLARLFTVAARVVDVFAKWLPLVVRVGRAVITYGGILLSVQAALWLYAKAQRAAAVAAAFFQAATLGPAGWARVAVAIGAAAATIGIMDQAFADVAKSGTEVQQSVKSVSNALGDASGKLEQLDNKSMEAFHSAANAANDATEGVKSLADELAKLHSELAEKIDDAVGRSVIDKLKEQVQKVTGGLNQAELPSWEIRLGGYDPLAQMREQLADINIGRLEAGLKPLDLASAIDVLGPKFSATITHATELRDKLSEVVAAQRKLDEVEAGVAFADRMRDANTEIDKIRHGLSDAVLQAREFAAQAGVTPDMLREYVRTLETLQELRFRREMEDRGLMQPELGRPEAYRRRPEGPSTRLAGAVEKGTSEAWSAIQNSIQGKADDAKKAEKQRDELRKEMEAHTREMTRLRQLWENAEEVRVPA